VTPVCCCQGVKRAKKGHSQQKMRGGKSHGQRLSQAVRYRGVAKPSRVGGGLGQRTQFKGGRVSP